MDAKHISNSKETDEDKIEQAERYKAEGNELFRNGDFKPAIKKYHYGLLYIKGIGEKHPVTGEQHILTSEWKLRHDQMKFGCYNNLAACLMKERKWEKVIEYSNKALEVQPDNLKAWFRTAQAHFHLGNLDKALEGIKKAEKIEPTDVNVKKCHVKIEQELRKYRDKEKAIYAGMFK